MRRELTPEEAGAWFASQEFRQAVKGGMVASVLDDSTGRYGVVEIVYQPAAFAPLIVPDPVVLWRAQVDGDDDTAEFFDADVNACGALEREILEKRCLDLKSETGSGS